MIKSSSTDPEDSTTTMSTSSNNSSTKEVWDLISSCNTASATLKKLLPVKICGSIVLGLVDSGNSFYNTISSAVAAKMGLTYYQPCDGPPVGTGSVGSKLDIIRLIHSTTFSLTDESGEEHKLTSRLVIAKHLSCGLNLSLPFLVVKGLDQLNSQGDVPEECQVSPLQEPYSRQAASESREDCLSQDQCHHLRG